MVALRVTEGGFSHLTLLMRIDRQFGGRRRHSFGTRTANSTRTGAIALLLVVCAWPWAAHSYAQPDPETSRVVRATNDDVSLMEADPLAEPLAAILIEGNDTIPEHAIIRHVTSRAGRASTPSQIKDDVRRLYDTRWFASITPLFRRTDEGLQLVFKVREKPVLQRVEFIGNKKIKTPRLEAETGLRPGAPFDVSINREAAERIKVLYREKGYLHVAVEMQQGDNPDHREAVFVINEGPKVRVSSVSIEGNEFVRDAVLKLKTETKPRFLFFIGGKYDPESIPNDELALEQYYQGLGFFDVDVVAESKFITDDKSLVDVVFHVKEQQRFKVRNVTIEGYDVVEEAKLREKLKLVSGEFFNARFLNEDVQSMKGQYDELGRLFAQVDAQPRFLQEPGWLDIVYKIDEDRPYLVGQINVHIRGDHPHTKEDVVRNQVNAYIQPGQLAKGSDIQRMRARLSGSTQLWEPTEPPAVNIRRVEGTEYLALDVSNRSQSPEVAATDKTESPEAVRTLKPDAFGHSVSGPEQEDLDDFLKGFAHPQRRDAAVIEAAPVATPPRSSWETSQVEPLVWEISPPGTIIRGQSDDAFFMEEPVTRGQSMNSIAQPAPQDLLQGVSPQGDPYGNALRGPILPGFIDVDIDVTEARTGRLMFGVGVNSNAGVVGSIILEENNFDILRPPTSFADITQGRAWRGGGQSFRLEAVPGNQVSRYLVSWQDPFFLNSDYSLGTSGFFFNRFYQDWTEQRLGGRISVGRLLGNFWSLSAALRLENVNVFDITTPPVPLLAEAEGNNFLSTARLALAHDTRNSSFFPTEGHFVEGSFEQAFHEFNYSRAELTGSQYFTLYQRPDGFGKQVLSLRGQLGYTGDDTPIFERFYAGGFQSFRGFAFRGVTPLDQGVQIGGQWLALGTVEYMVPITAGDAVRGVVFSDFGTVEQDVTLDQFRVSVGAGLRLQVPAMGPAPIALDFAYPIVKEDFDDRQIFSFYVGFTR